MDSGGFCLVTSVPILMVSFRPQREYRSEEAEKRDLKLNCRPRKQFLLRISVVGRTLCTTTEFS